MRRFLKKALGTVGEVLNRFRKHRCIMLAAGVAYFALVSLAPMIVLALSVTSLFVDPAAGETQLLTQIETIVGEAGTETIAGMIESAQLAERTPAMAIVGVVVLVFGATTLFAKLTDSFNVIFGQGPLAGSSTVWRTIRSRLISLSVVVGIGFLLLISLIVDTAVVSLFGRIKNFLAERLAFLLAAVQAIASVGITTVLLSAVMKVMPARHVSWADAFAGGVVAAVLFSATKLLFGLYLGSRDVASSYGAAGAVVVVLLWVYAGGIVLFLGGEYAALRIARREEL
jgi:membrane protein